MRVGDVFIIRLERNPGDRVYNRLMRSALAQLTAQMPIKCERSGAAAARAQRACVCVACARGIRAHMVVLYAYDGGIRHGMGNS